MKHPPFATYPRYASSSFFVSLFPLRPKGGKKKMVVAMVKKGNEEKACCTLYNGI